MLGILDGYWDMGYLDTGHIGLVGSSTDGILYSILVAFVYSGIGQHILSPLTPNSDSREWWDRASVSSFLLLTPPPQLNGAI